MFWIWETRLALQGWISIRLRDAHSYNRRWHFYGIVKPSWQKAELLRQQAFWGASGGEERGETSWWHGAFSGWIWEYFSVGTLWTFCSHIAQQEVPKCILVAGDNTAQGTQRWQRCQTHPVPHSCFEPSPAQESRFVPQPQFPFILKRANSQLFMLFDELYSIIKHLAQHLTPSLSPPQLRCAAAAAPFPAQEQGRFYQTMQQLLNRVCILLNYKVFASFPG